MFGSYISWWMIGWTSHMCISGISLAMCIISVCRILFSQHYRYVFCAKNVAAHATATSAPDHPVWFHGSRGEIFSSLLGVWHRRKRSVRDIVDQIQVKISSREG